MKAVRKSLKCYVCMGLLVGRRLGPTLSPRLKNAGKTITEDYAAQGFLLGRQLWSPPSSGRQKFQRHRKDEARTCRSTSRSTSGQTLTARTRIRTALRSGVTTGSCGASHFQVGHPSTCRTQLRGYTCTIARAWGSSFYPAIR